MKYFTKKVAERFGRACLEVMGPTVEAYAGKLPEYEVWYRETLEILELYDEVTGSRHVFTDGVLISPSKLETPIKDMKILKPKVFKDYTPFHVKHHEGKPIFTFYRMGTRKRLIEKLAGNDYIYTIGDWAHSLVHDLFHIYQQKALIDSQIDGLYDHWVWLEGVADLCAWKVCSDIYTNSSSVEEIRDKSLDGLLKFVLNSLEENRLKEGLEMRLGKAGSRYHAVLNSSIGEFLPFELPSGINERINRLVSGGKPKNKKKMEKQMKRDDPYARGFAYFGKLSKETGKDIKEFLKTPVSNKDLKTG